MFKNTYIRNYVFLYFGTVQIVFMVICLIMFSILNYYDPPFKMWFSFSSFLHKCPYLCYVTQILVDKSGKLLP